MIVQHGELDDEPLGAYRTVLCANDIHAACNGRVRTLTLDLGKCRCACHFPKNVTPRRTS